MRHVQVTTVSLVRERRTDEGRVLLAPADVACLRADGLQVLVERDAGEGAGFGDRAYVEAGAELVGCDEAWRRADVVAKYKAPAASEYGHFRPDLTLLAFLHAEGDLALMDALEATNVSAWALEFVQDADGSFPGCVSDSKIAGTQAVIYGAWLLQAPFGGSGKLLASVRGVPDPKVVVIGHGNAGGAAARTAAALGASVTVFGRSEDKLRRFAATVDRAIECRLNTPEALEAAVAEADLVIGAILISSHDTPAMLGPALVQRMRPGSVIVDITCGYGRGYLPTASRATSFAEPAVVAHEVLHVKIDAMPAAVPWTASRATSAQVFRYVREILAHVAFGRAIAPGVLAARVAHGGQVVHPELHRQRRLAMQSR